MLMDFIKQFIGANGAMTVADYISACLYHRDFGYYRTKNPFGMGGDFVTASQLTSLFGEVIGLFFAAQWQRLFNKRPVTFIELGAGNGFFMRDMLLGTAKIPDFHENIRILMVEKSENLVKEQKKILEPFREKIEILWYKDMSFALDDLVPDEPVFIFANEFFDAFPVRQFAKSGVSWNEINVVLQDGGLAFAKSSSDYATSLLPFISLTGADASSLPDDSVIEISFDAIRTYNMLVEVLKKHGGCGLVIDYGFVNNQFVSTLQAVQNHKPVNPLECPGLADLTYLLDFRFYYNIAKRLDLTVYPPITQGDFLRSIGIEELKNLALKNETNEAKRKLIEIAVNRLIDPKEMGDLFKVLLLEYSQDGLVV